MNRYDIIEDYVYKLLEKECFGNKKKQAYRHLLGVSELCIILARKEKLDNELAGIMGLLHDLTIYKDHSHFDHASRSAILAKNILEATQLFNEKEISIVEKAIKNHSNKKQYHDDYSELLKLCDVINSYLYEPNCILNPDQNKYLQLAKEKDYI